MKQELFPTISDLCLESVLMQAWKKTSAYLRSHSWYADILGIDCETLRIPLFIEEITNLLRKNENWQPHPIKLIPAPKNQHWVYSNADDGGVEWAPQPRESVEEKIRPLAHLDLQDQTLATGIMLCLADRVETCLGDPRLPIQIPANRKKVLAYGHRLFCDTDEKGNLFHRWGSSTLYRQYYQDYHTFLERPKIVAQEIIKSNENFEVAIVQSDLSKFYDRVRPSLLKEKLLAFCASSTEAPFFDLAATLFNWEWSDKSRALRYAKNNKIENFSHVALPQGLVCSGFFANVVLHDLDLSLRSLIDHDIADRNFILKDACYYVDDFRFVFTVPSGTPEKEIKDIVVKWFQLLLDRCSPGLEVSENKTEVTVDGREKRFLVMQSREAQRIQRQVSGTFDMLHGSELIGAIEGFFHTQKQYSIETTATTSKRDTGLLIGIPDMRDDTAARFAAGRFRKTFRSLRPLLTDENELSPSNIFNEENFATEDETKTFAPRLIISKNELDQRAKFFSALLIEEWIKNPGNIRLLRIALDIYPSHDFLRQVLNILRPSWNSTRFRKAKLEIRLFCLAEIFRAGATETGVVSDDDYLPKNISVEKYRNLLIKEGQDIIIKYRESNNRSPRFPWYLLQQVFLYLAVNNVIPPKINGCIDKNDLSLSLYRQYADFLAGILPSSIEKQAIFVIISITSHGINASSIPNLITNLSKDLFFEIAKISPHTAYSLWNIHYEDFSRRLLAYAHKLGMQRFNIKSKYYSVEDLSTSQSNPFLEEENLLILAEWLFAQPDELFDSVLPPWRIGCEVKSKHGYEFSVIDKIRLLPIKNDRPTFLYQVPDWLETKDERKNYKIGLLLRFAIKGNIDFFYGHSSKPHNINLLRYTPPSLHWEQQKYSNFQGRSSFGPAWVPLSSFVEELLFHLLRWPGSGSKTPFVTCSEWLKKIQMQLESLRKNRGSVSSITFLEQDAPFFGKTENSPVMRIGIVQSITPSADDYHRHRRLEDPELLHHDIRLRQKRHLSSVIEAVSQMLVVRNTHPPRIPNNNRIIDLLIFPELAIHPLDIKPFLVPFIRKYKCLMLFGLVYHPIHTFPNAPLINSCLWMIPNWSPTRGFYISTVEQGKKHLASNEQRPDLQRNPIPFRPAQWLIKYHWHNNLPNYRPLSLSASICYDATDLRLAADLRDKSDIFIVCALNKDIKTFDRMSESLHYHMYQGVIVVNNGQFGGSSFFMPFQTEYHRQILQLHGQPQASIALADISPEKIINRFSNPAPLPQGEDQNQGNEQNTELPAGVWKTPPAGILD